MIEHYLRKCHIEIELKPAIWSFMDNVVRGIYTAARSQGMKFDNLSFDHLSFDDSLIYVLK